MGLKRRQPPAKGVDDLVKTRTNNPEIRDVQTEEGNRVQIVVAPSYNVPEIFEWDALKIRVAEMIADGVPINAITGLPGMPASRTTIYNWLKHPDYKKYIDSLVMETGFANQAERMAGMKKVLDKMYDKLVKDLGNINLTDKNASTLIGKFFDGLRQIQEDANGYVKEVRVTSESTVNASVANSFTFDLDRALNQAPSEKRAMLQKEFADRADSYIRQITTIQGEQ